MIDKGAAMRAHLDLFRRGELAAARLVLRGLRIGTVVLGLSDPACAAEWALRENGATFCPMENGAYARCRITEGARRVELMP